MKNVTEVTSFCERFERVSKKKGVRRFYTLKEIGVDAKLRKSKDAFSKGSFQEGIKTVDRQGI